MGVTVRVGGEGYSQAWGWKWARSNGGDSHSLDGASPFIAPLLIPKLASRSPSLTPTQSPRRHHDFVLQVGPEDSLIPKSKPQPYLVT